ncbi:MAG TPA: NADH-quinone oxidoreductase subunit N [Chthoniobacteraceae bacterium]|jgi:NADH-quinone oxidoreductase subunit N|nr:NADH-quinone oxidoreductase subunit N [Chthoniobacteraceae bacterium]
MSYLSLLKLAAPEALLVFAALVTLAFGLAKSSVRRLCPAIAIAGLAAAGAALFALPLRASLPHGLLVIDPLSCLFKVICLALALFTILSASGRADRANPGEYLALILFATVGLLILAGTENLMMIFIGLELIGLSLYVLCAFDKTSERGAEAGLKYFLFGSTASAFTLFGISLIYGMTGAAGLREIAQSISAHGMQPLLAAGLVLVLVGLSFKIAAAPFHLWAPDAYEAAPVSSAAFIASGSKVASFVILGRVLEIGFAPAQGSAEWHAFAAGWAPLLAVLAAVSIVVGNVAALAQTSVRRLLGYSAVAHAGYTLLGLVAGGREGFGATLFYTTVYAFTLVGAFSIIGAMQRDGLGDGIADFAGLRARSPLLAGCMAVFFLSLAGLPPLPGFFGKFYLFLAVLHYGRTPGMLWLIILALAGSLVSLYYYLQVLKAALVDEGPAAPLPLRWLDRATILTLGALVLALGFCPGLLLQRILDSLR